MKPAIHERDGGLERVWRTEILPLLEELHYGEGVDVAAAYGLRTLRTAALEEGRPDLGLMDATPSADGD